MGKRKQSQPVGPQTVSQPTLRKSRRVGHPLYGFVHEKRDERRGTRRAFLGAVCDSNYMLCNGSRDNRKFGSGRWVWRRIIDDKSFPLIEHRDEWGTRHPLSGSLTQLPKWERLGHPSL